MSFESLHKYLVCTAIALAFVVIVLGAYTRLVDAGLGCPDWPRCYGFLLLPTSESEISLANDRFSATPYERDKAIPEVVHRIVAGGLGILIAGILFVSWHTKKSLVLPLVLFGLVVFQAILGAWTVTLKLWPQVVVAHLIGGFSLLGLLYIYALKVGYLPYRPIRLSTKVPLVLFLTFLVCQIILGGWTSANYAALACPDFPLCHGKLLPDMNFKEGFNFAQDIGPNYLGGNISSEARVAIQVSHRIGAVVVLFSGLLLLFTLPPGARIHLGTLLICQVTLGILNIWLNLPLHVAVLHNLGAVLLLLSSLQILFSLAPVAQLDRARASGA